MSYDDYKKKTTKNTTRKSIKFNYKFASIIAPNAIKDYSLETLKYQDSKSHKIFIKQSYLLMVWMTYVQGNKWQDNEDLLKSPKLFVLPKKVSKFTLTKAPMAHKTFSQEQYSYNRYSLTMSFSKPVPGPLNSINSSILFLLKNPLSRSFIETNLFFITKLSISVLSSDKNFMTYLRKTI